MCGKASLKNNRCGYCSSWINDYLDVGLGQDLKVRTFPTGEKGAE